MRKDADQPAHARSLISTFVVRCLDIKVMKLSFITINYAREVSFYGVIGVARIAHMIVWGRAGNQTQ